MSAPAQNSLPCPVSTTTRTLSSSDMRSNASAISSCICRLSALTGGLVIVATATWSVISMSSSFRS